MSSRMMTMVLALTVAFTTKAATAQEVLNMVNIGYTTSGTEEGPSFYQTQDLTSLRTWADSNFVYGLGPQWGSTSYSEGSEDGTENSVNLAGDEIKQVEYYCSTATDHALTGLKFTTKLGTKFSIGSLLGLTKAMPADAVLTGMTSYTGTIGTSTIIWGVTLYFTTAIDGSTMQMNQALYQGESVYSPDGQSRLVMQTDGNLVLYQNGSAVWATNTGSGYILWVQGDGNLVVYDDAQNPVWASNTGDTGPGNYLQLENGGNLVLDNSEGAPVWSSGG